MPAPDWKKWYKSMFHDEKPHVVIACVAVAAISVSVFCCFSCLWFIGELVLPIIKAIWAVDRLKNGPNPFQ